MRALQPVDSGAPPFEIANSELRSGRSSSDIASHASSSGLATASPTTVIDCTPSSATVRHTRAGIERARHQHHPRPAEEPHERRPLRGRVHQRRQRHVGEVDAHPIGQLRRRRHLALHPHRVAAAEAREERVALAPHDALGHPGGAAGVHHVVVVVAAIAAGRAIAATRRPAPRRSRSPVTSDQPHVRHVRAAPRRSRRGAAGRAARRPSRCRGGGTRARRRRSGG